MSLNVDKDFVYISPDNLKNNVTVTNPLTINVTSIAASNPLERTPSTDTVNFNTNEINKRQKEEYVKESPLLMAYEKITKLYENNIFFHDMMPEDNINVIEKAKNIDELKKIDAVCQDINDKIQNDENGFIKSNILKNFVDLYYKDSTLYDYGKNSHIIRDIFMAEPGVSDTLNILNLGSLKEVEKGSFHPKLLEYTYDSDEIYKSPQKIRDLHNLLATNKTEEDMTVYRGEREVGLFNNTSIDNKLEKKIKLANFVCQIATKKENYNNFEKSCHNNVLPKKETLYDHIKDKEKLSLADAMLMMKYLDKNSQKDIIKSIKKAKLDDNDGRFKSTTLSKTFAKQWANCFTDSHQYPTIISKINIKKGCEGYYVQGQNVDETTGQYEFILNNKPRKTTITEVSYDDKNDRFNIDYDLEMLN